MERQITRDGTIMIDGEEIDGEELVSIMRSRDTYAGWKRDGDKRIAELEAALRALLKGCERYDNNPDSAVAGAAYDAGMDAARKALGT